MSGGPCFQGQASRPSPWSWPYSIAWHSTLMLWPQPISTVSPHPSPIDKQSPSAFWKRVCSSMPFVGITFPSFSAWQIPAYSFLFRTLVNRLADALQPDYLQPLVVKQGGFATHCSEGEHTHGDCGFLVESARKNLSQDLVFGWVI